MRKFLPLVALLALLPVTATANDWPTYHSDNTRQGNDTSDPGLANPVTSWTSALLNGNVYSQPVVAGSQVIVADEQNTVYSLRSSDGTVQWSADLGTMGMPPRTSGFACGNVNPLGITGTPVIDGGNVYVALEEETSSSPLTLHFVLASLSLSTGAVNWTHIIDPPDPGWGNYVQYEQERGAILASGGKIFMPLGGLYGDCGTYHGYVLGYSENNTGSVGYWASTQVDPSNNRGGIWAAGGISQDAAGYIYAATGNSNHTSSGSTYDYSDGVIKLNPNALAPGAPYDFFAPGNWYLDNAGDVDLGSVVPLQLPNNRVFIVGKSGNGYLLNSTNLGHVGGQIAINRVCNATNDAAFGSLAYANGIAYVGCSDGVAAVQINGAGTSFSTLWYNTTNVADHPPIVAGGVVWSLDSASTTLFGLNANTGALVHSFSVPGSTHFTSPTAANGQLYIAAGTHVYAFSGCGGGPLVAGFSGSGKADLAVIGSTGTCVLVSTGTAFSAPAAWSTVPFYGNVTTLAGDVTGSGKAALIAVNHNATFVMTSTGTGFNAPALWSSTPFYGTRGTFLADVNGDGKADLVAVNDTSTWVMLSTGTAFGAPTLWTNTPFYGNIATLIGDVNGDGKADLIALNNSSTWVMTSTGAGFSAPALWTNTPFYGNKTTLVGDANGDGKADLIAVNNSSTWVMTSTGTGFNAPAIWSSTSFYGLQATLEGDLNGDKTADLVAVNYTSIFAMTSNGSIYSSPALWLAGPP